MVPTEIYIVEVIQHHGMPLQRKALAALYILSINTVALHHLLTEAQDNADQEVRISAVNLLRPDKPMPDDVAQVERLRRTHDDLQQSHKFTTKDFMKLWRRQDVLQKKWHLNAFSKQNVAK